MRIMPYKAGEVVLVNFPFTNLASTKRRPALVLVDQADADVLCVPISSGVGLAGHDLRVDAQACVGFEFPIQSYVRPRKLMTLESVLIQKSLGQVSSVFLKQVKAAVKKFLDL